MGRVGALIGGGQRGARRAGRLECHARAGKARCAAQRMERACAAPGRVRYQPGRCPLATSRLRPLPPTVAALALPFLFPGGRLPVLPCPRPVPGPLPVPCLYPLHCVYLGSGCPHRPHLALSIALSIASAIACKAPPPLSRMHPSPMPPRTPALASAGAASPRASLRPRSQLCETAPRSRSANGGEPGHAGTSEPGKDVPGQPPGGRTMTHGGCYPNDRAQTNTFAACSGGELQPANSVPSAETLGTGKRAYRGSGSVRVRVRVWLVLFFRRNDASFWLRLSLSPRPWRSAPGLAPSSSPQKKIKK